MPKTFWQSSSPERFTTKVLSENHWNTVEYLSEKKDITIVRFFLSKLFFAEECFTLAEKVALFLSFEKVVIACQRNKEYRQKYQREIFDFRAIFQSLESLSMMSPTIRTETLREHYSHKMRGNFVSRRYYYAMKGQLQKLFLLRIKTRWPKKFPPKAYVGKGYGDKGSAKDAAYDGNPDWREIAMDETNQTDQQTGKDEEGIWSSLRVHSLQLITAHDLKKDRKPSG